MLAGLTRKEFTDVQLARVALEAGRPVARLVARLSPQLRDDRGRPYGLLGFFEALDRPDAPDAVARLFEEAVAWLRQKGAGPIVGPMDGDTWHRYRLNVGPFDEPPFLLEPYNPPYYEALWEGSGFQVLERYFSKRVEIEAVIAHLETKQRAAFEAGYRLRRIDMGRFEDELRLLYQLSRQLFAGNFLYTEIAEEDFLALYADSRPILDPDLVWFAEAAHPEGTEPVGFLFAYPDRSPVVDFKTLGVLPGHRRAGVAAALFHRGHQIALEKGYRIANHCLFREGNPSGDLDGGAGRLLRRYHLYQLGEDAGR